MKRFVFVLLMLLLCLSAGWSRLARADAVTEWNETAGEAALAACIAPISDPLHESRMYAMMHTAIHDALNAIERHSRPYTFDSQALADTSVDATVATAARDVLVPLLNELPNPPFPPECVTAGVALVEAAYTAALAAIAEGAAKTQGIALGQAAATAILTLRAHDGSDTPLLDTTYPQGTAPGEYRFTPGFPFFFGPGWADVTPFVLRDSAQFRFHAGGGRKRAVTHPRRISLPQGRPGRD